MPRSNWMRRPPQNGLNARGFQGPTSVLNVLNTILPSVLLWEGLRPFLRRVRGGRRTFYYGRFWDHFLYFFAFFSLLTSSWLFYRFFFSFHRFSVDFGRILGGFWDDVSTIFRVFLENRDFIKYSVLHRKNHYFSYVELMKINKKSTKNR